MPQSSYMKLWNMSFYAVHAMYHVYVIWFIMDFFMVEAI